MMMMMMMMMMMDCSLYSVHTSDIIHIILFKKNEYYHLLSQMKKASQRCQVICPRYTGRKWQSQVGAPFYSSDSWHALLPVSEAGRIADTAAQFPFCKMGPKENWMKRIHLFSQG
jgi:hypothetical protein